MADFIHSKSINSDFYSSLDRVWVLKPGVVGYFSICNKSLVQIGVPTQVVSVFAK